MEITIVHEAAIPLHVQLLNQMRHLILSGRWIPGSRIPSEPELQHKLQISRSTIRQALSNAEAEGLIVRVPGKGTFVARSPTDKVNSHLIGYITSQFLTDFQRQLLEGAESTARAKRYRILFCSADQDLKEETRLLDQLLLEDKVGGILIWPAMGGNSSRRLFQLANQGSISLVLMDRTLEGLAFDFVTSDNYAGGYAATEHLVGLGHRRIVFLSRPMLQLLPVAERLRGYQDAMQDAGLTPLEPWLAGVAGQEMVAGDALRTYRDASSQEIREIARYLEEPQRPTAIFAINDLTAMHALRAASLMGMRVPDDLSVVGFDDMNIVANLEVPLTTVAQDTLRIGSRAAELLIERIEGYDGPPRKEVVPIQLRVRASTAPPATS
jgi:GntR family transcriptional regulator of arabinose operon